MPARKAIQGRAVQPEEHLFPDDIVGTNCFPGDPPKALIVCRCCFPPFRKTNVAASTLLIAPPKSSSSFFNKRDFSLWVHASRPLHSLTIHVSTLLAPHAAPPTPQIHIHASHHPKCLHMFIIYWPKMAYVECSGKALVTFGEVFDTTISRRDRGTKQCISISWDWKVSPV